MTKCNHPHRLAGTAIAAFLALSSTAILAQEAPAPIDATAAAPVAQPAPTIVLPSLATVQPMPAPAVESAPAVEAAPAPRAGTSAPARTARAAPVRPVATAPVAASPAANPVSVEPPIAAGTIPSDLAPAEPVATAAPADRDDSNGLLLAGLAGALGLGAIGLFAATRRRRVEPADALVEYEPLAAPAAPVAVATPKPATLVAPAFTPMARWSEPRVPLAQPADSRALSLNREALLERMVAAEPDANNPFTSGKARRRRARLMLQSMESNRWDDAELAPGFDWREMAQAVEERETVQA